MNNGNPRPSTKGVALGKTAQVKRDYSPRQRTRGWVDHATLKRDCDRGVDFFWASRGGRPYTGFNQ